MSSFAGRSQQMYFPSLVAPLKDEERYLIEFVNYYLIHGVDHFYFYDNGSTIPVREVLTEYRGHCTVMRAPGDAVQIRAYAASAPHQALTDRSGRFARPVK